VNFANLFVWVEVGVGVHLRKEGKKKKNKKKNTRIGSDDSKQNKEQFPIICEGVAQR
jgi:hypothetical protein